ncbi:MAG: hypothetical protein A3H27_03670 [Acidobacteria bacterium RIFCSPLOWO2_02_FULL_59_13]|nr:MAG: hypothetical protein A3H27_03670 [Acidobacteria bacterium RIFCSPLOWO2_02_FULL_59_13]
MWDSLDSSPVVQLPPLIHARRGHTATLLNDGNVLLQGGVDNNGDALQNSELFDSSSRRFSTAVENPTSEFQNPILVASIPVSGSVDVPVETVISLRFSKPLRVESINVDTITVSGPQAIEAVKVVPAEGGMLAFITPEADLLPGATYFLTVNGALDREGLLLPVSGISFTTQTIGTGGQSTTGGASQSSGTQPQTGSSNSDGERSDDGSEWRGTRRDGRPHSPWQDLPPLQGSPGVTALAGQVLDLHGRPLANVTLEIEAEYGGTARSARTDETGRFLITDFEAGWRELIIDGRGGHNPRSKIENPKWGYGVFEYGLQIIEGQTNVLAFTIWLPKIDTVHTVSIPSPTTSEVVVTSPRLQGLELRIPANTTIYDYEGEIVREVNLTPIPIDRTPFPLPRNVHVPIYFTAQPGGAYITNPDNLGARIHYPNSFNDLPGTRYQFWHYDPGYRGWYVYGLGTVPEDGRQVIPDPGISIHEFTGAMVAGTGLAPASGPKPPCDDPQCKPGDPVDATTGLFVLNKTDLYIPDGTAPIEFKRTYRPGDTFSRAFGLGASHSYDLFLVGDTHPYTFIDLILPDGGRIHYDRISPGTGFADAVYEHVSTPTRYYKSKIAWNGTGWSLTLKDGTLFRFDEGDGATRPGQGGVLSIVDRNGNQTTIARDSAGNTTKITSPGGRWVEFTYDASNRITQAKDTIGRVVTYEYDATGRLIKVTDPNGGITEYTYDASSRMLTLKDARGIVYLTNEYDATGKVTKQTMVDTGTYLFSYTMNGSDVAQMDVTDPRGKVSRRTLNLAGQLLSYTNALGQPEEQVTTNTVQSGTNFILSQVDPLGRTTSYTYDSLGNTTSVTRLSGTSDAVTTSFTYEPTFNQLASATDPLSHTTTYNYDPKGNLTSIANALNQTTTIARNAAGQPVSVTDPLNHTTQFAYEFGDLASVTDPLGNVSSRLTDAAGRVINQTNPLGNPTIYNYDVLNRLAQVLDPLNGATGFSYDANGNLLSVTDARSNATAYTYDSMDRLATRVDPLTRSESYQYDLAGNMTQFTDRKSQGTTYTYDALNRRTGVTYADASTTAYAYDAGNRLTQVVDSIAGTITRTYDGLNRLTSEITPQGSVSYTYDGAGRRTSMTVAGQSAVNYTYDNANRVTQITQGSGTVSYTYDAAGRRTSLTLPNGVLVEYAYDAASRLTGITYKQNGTTLLGNLTYEYDKNGNRTKIGGSFARTGLPQSITTTVYNAANHQTTFGDKTLTYDNNGNLQAMTDSSGTTTYTWNARNQLTGISGPGVSASFVYDGLGRREAKTINGSLTEFLFDGRNPVQETSGATVLGNILPGLGIDEFLTRTDVVAGTTSNFLTDALGSPVAVTDNAGAVQTEYTYEPFGNTTFSGASNSSSYQYTGRENDGTGLYYYRNRYSHPQLQRFMSEDPIEFDGGDVNLYNYVGNAPLDFVDPLGLTHAERHGSHRNLRDACRIPNNCFPPPPPPNNKSDPPPPIPPEPDYSDICKYGCTTDQGKVYPDGSDEPIIYHPSGEALRGFGDAAKAIINLIRNKFGPGTNPEY